MKQGFTFFGWSKADVSRPELLVLVLSYLDEPNLERLKSEDKDFATWVPFARLLKVCREQIPTLKFTQASRLFAERLDGGKTNDTFKISLPSKQSYVVRQVGAGSEAFIVRQDEFNNAAIVSEAKLNVPIVYSEPDGLQMTVFVDNAVPLSINNLNRQHLGSIAKLFKQLHSQEKQFCNDNNGLQQAENLLAELRKKNFNLPDITAILTGLETLKKLFEKLGPLPSSNCHKDPTISNFLLSPEKIFLIDWEYSSKDVFFWDLAYFSIEAKLNKTQEKIFLLNYFGSTRQNHLDFFIIYKVLACWWISLWYWTQISNQSEDPAEYTALAMMYYEKTLEMIQDGGFLDACRNLDSDDFDAKPIFGLGS